MYIAATVNMLLSHMGEEEALACNSFSPACLNFPFAVFMCTSVKMT